MKLKVYVFLSLCVLLGGAVLNRTTRPTTKDRLAFRDSAVFSTTERSFEAVAKASPDENKARLANSYGRMPLYFEANQGQTDPQVKFVTRGSGYRLFLTRRSEAVLVLRRSMPKRGALRPAALSSSTIAADSGAVGPPAVVRMKLLGGKTTPQVEGLDELPGKANYLVGNNPKKWHTNIPTYAKVGYRNVYPGVDLVYHGDQRQLEYDFVVAPGADPRRIALRLEGVEKLEVDPEGDLVVHTAVGEFRDQEPLIYQEVNGVRREIAGGYALKGKQTVGFQVAAYDSSRPLVIDPVLFYSTYLGGSGSDLGQGIAVDSSGNAYVTGATGSSNFPTVTGAFQRALRGGSDVFVTKFNPTGRALVYSTYVGGSNGEFGAGITVGPSGNAYVTGGTSSGDFPTTVGAFRTTFTAPAGADNAFVMELNPSGSALVYSTYLGGNGDDRGTGIAIDALGNAYVAGGTSSTNFPTTPGAFQTTCRAQRCTRFTGTGAGFVTKLNPSGTALVYSTYLSGSNGDINAARGIAVDLNNNAYVVGATNSSDFPTTPGAFQSVSPKPGGICAPNSAYVTKLNTLGTGLVYSTYLGASGNFPSCSGYNDNGTGIAIDSTGNAYVTGNTVLTNFPTTTGAFQTTYGPGSNNVGSNGFVTKLNPLGTGLVYSTYLGGSGGDSGLGIAVDVAGDAFVAGFTNSSNFPTANPKQPALAGGFDAFVSEVNPLGTGLAFSTFLGGSSHDFGVGIAVDTAGNAYITGYTCSTDFPVTYSAFQTANASGGCVDAFVTKITGFPAAADAAITATGVTFSATEGRPFAGTVANFHDPDLMSTAAEYSATIAWGDGSSSAGTITPTGISPKGNDFAVTGNHTYTEEGTYTVAVTITDVDNPKNTATATSTATVVDAALHSSCAAAPASTQSFSGPTATFTDDNPFGTQADFSATINWGDSTTSSGTIGGGPGAGPYTVSGNHTYSTTGTFTISTLINDDGGAKTAATCQVIVFAFPTATGAFVIGDLADPPPIVGDSVTWWSSQWAKLNPMSGGPAPASMKGFAGFEDNPLGTPRTCGSSWTTDTGNATPPPPSVPAFMGVLVSSMITQNGSVITGNIKQVVVVRNNPGYAPNPGNPGTGTIVAIVCAIP